MKKERYIVDKFTNVDSPTTMILMKTRWTNFRPRQLRGWQRIQIQPVTTKEEIMYISQYYHDFGRLTWKMKVKFWLKKLLRIKSPIHVENLSSFNSLTKL